MDKETEHIELLWLPTCVLVLTLFYVGLATETPQTWVAEIKEPITILSGNDFNMADCALVYWEGNDDYYVCYGEGMQFGDANESILIWNDSNNIEFWIKYDCDYPACQSAFYDDNKSEVIQ